MMIFHGDDQVSSRAAYLTEKNRAKSSGANAVEYTGDALQIADIETAVRSSSLFGTQNAVFIENLFSSRDSRSKKSLADFLKSLNPENVFVWETKDVSSQLKSFPPGTAKKFDLPKSLWQFLDAFSLPGLHSALAATPAEQILALLASRLQQLILVKEGLIPASLASWQVNKLKSQAAKFTLAQLTTCSQQLLDIDLAQKTSSSASGLDAALELWIVKNVNWG